MTRVTEAQLAKLLTKALVNRDSDGEQIGENVTAAPLFARAIFNFWGEDQPDETFSLEDVACVCHVLSDLLATFGDRTYARHEREAGR